MVDLESVSQYHTRPVPDELILSRSWVSFFP